MTDIHIGFDPDAKPEELNRIRFRQTLDRLLAQPNTIDLLVLSGDLTDHGDKESFEKTAELLESVPCPILPMVGNHDSREGLLHAFPNTPMQDGFLHYTHEQDGLLILLLDTLEAGRHGGAFCSARRDWLRATLEANRSKPTLIFMHHPPVVSGIDWMDPAADEDWIANFAAAIDGHDQILAIHCGHLHRPLLASFRGVPLGVTPSVAPLVSLDLRPIDPERADNRDLITTEPSTYALHRWDGKDLVTHYEKTNEWDVVAHYSDDLKPMMRDMFRERE
ncbi:metallophosphoesterase [Altererythrobacter sp.]|uniref:metallophosphoesterase n=1 Tax=Altererythrobacter sp. TaxID=1872480 RepID=UPI003D07D492